MSGGKYLANDRESRIHNVGVGQGVEKKFFPKIFIASFDQYSRNSSMNGNHMR